MEQTLTPQTLRCALLAAQAEEDALEGLLTTPVLEVTLRVGTESFTVPVTPAVGNAVVHELLLAAIARRQQAAHQERQARLTVRSRVLSALLT